jgi:hypothetical protein
MSEMRVVNVGCDIIGNCEIFEICISCPQRHLTADFATIGAGIARARPGAATGALMMGLFGPIPCGWRIVSTVPVVAVGDKEGEFLYVSLSVG